MKFIIRTSPILLALALATPLTRAQTVEQLTFKSIYAEADFAYLDDTGCIVTLIQVLSIQGITEQTGQQKTTSPHTTVDLVRFDLCMLSHCSTLLATRRSRISQSMKI